MNPHPLIAWMLEFDKWHSTLIDLRKIDLNEDVLRLAILGKCLEKTRYQAGFEKLVNRLKKEVSFFSSAFEVEVAEAYLSEGHTIRFIEEGTDRTPDLKVTRSNGSKFWVECKSRDKLTERDEKIKGMWADLEGSLLREIGPKKLNVAIFVKSLRDPLRSEIDYLRKFLLSCIKTGGVGMINHETGIHDFALDPTQKYQVVVQPLSDPDEEFEAAAFGFTPPQKPDRYFVKVENRVDENKRCFIKNPIAIGFVNDVLSDNISGIINSFKSALGQLPEQGPGVIWIRVPDNAWNDDLDSAMDKAKSILEHELSYDVNRRINAVMLMTRVVRSLKDSGNHGLGYQPVRLIVVHPNPRTAEDAG